MKVSNSFKIIFGFLVVLLIGVIASVYEIDINKYLNNFNDNLSNNSKATEDITVELIKCIDGDTVKFKEDGKIHTYRFLGINTPETTTNEKYSKEAKNYTCEKLTNAKKITIQYEDTSSHIDKYERRLVWVFVDGDLLQVSLLEQGLAKVSYVYTKLTYLKDLYKALKVAETNKLKLYSNYNSKTYADEDCTVIFDISGSRDEVTVKKGDIITLPNNPKKEGYTFNGWMNGDSLYDFSKPITDNLILYPSYTKNT